VQCHVVRTHLVDAHTGRLPASIEADVRAHLETCPACAHEDAAERALTDVLESRLPQHPASRALKRRLAAQWPDRVPAAAPSRWRRWSPWLMPAAAAAVLLLVALPVYQGRRDTGFGALMSEAVNDHLRVLQPERPLGVVSGESHQVKPWFSGRLDFAPVVSFPGDAEFPLKGGSVEYFLDRRAAVYVYGRRLHTISLFVFRPDGLSLPAGRRAEDHVRGFNVILWRSGDLGYALVSDVNAGELRMLAERLSPPA
jgi:anti-sigma factor RsiW